VDNPNDQLSVEWVTEAIIRQQYNDSQLFEKWKSGEIVGVTKRSSHPDTPPVGEPICTHSQIVYYYSRENKPLAIVHQYLRPDGTIGASGFPDPKRLFLKDKILFVRSARPKDNTTPTE